MTKRNYAPPIDKLLKLGPVGGETEDSWPNYIKEFGLSQQDIPELTRLATDYELRFSEEDEGEDEYEDEEEEDVAYWGASTWVARIEPTKSSECRRRVD